MNSSYIQTTNTTAGNPSLLKIQVGDFPYEPYQPTIDPYTPIPTPAPILIPADAWHPHDLLNQRLKSWSAGVHAATNPWQLIVKEDRIIAKIDVPGCKADGIDLTLNDGTLSVRAHRKDDGSYSSFATHIGSDYDSETAEAEIEDGVLTVTVTRFTKKIEKRIVVRKK